MERLKARTQLAACLCSAVHAVRRSGGRPCLGALRGGQFTAQLARPTERESDREIKTGRICRNIQK